VGQLSQNDWGLLMQVVADACPGGHVVLRHGESDPIDHCPGAQHLQSAVGSVAFAGAALPAPQFVGSHRAAPFPSEYLPAGHGAHDVAPAGAKYPAVSHAQHEMAPVKSEYLPAGHALQSPPPALPELPAVQLLQLLPLPGLAAAHVDSGGTVKPKDWV
jgi:hypothetical protein